MTTVRQDAWSTDEDLILAEVVLRHIREGSTQLAAFEEVGERLNRTSAACGFRWNSTIRKKYESAIALAKKQRSKTKKTALPTVRKEASDEEVIPDQQEQEPMTVSVEVPSKTSDLTMEKVIAFLTEYDSQPDPEVMEQLNQLKDENQSLKEQLKRIMEEKQIMTEDYRSLLTIMDRARKFTF